MNMTTNHIQLRKVFIVFPAAFQKNWVIQRNKGQSSMSDAYLMAHHESIYTYHISVYMQFWG